MVNDSRLFVLSEITVPAFSIDALLGLPRIETVVILMLLLLLWMSNAMRALIRLIHYVWLIWLFWFEIACNIRVIELRCF